MKNEDLVSLNIKNGNNNLSSCHYDLGESNSAKLSARHATEMWLKRKVETMGLNARNAHNQSARGISLST